MKKKLLAIFEILGIIAGGWILTTVFINLFNVAPLQELLDKAIATNAPDYLRLAEVGFYTLFIQFLCLIIPAYLVTRFLHKGNFKRFGITKGKASFRENIEQSIILFCLLGIPMKVLLILHHFIDVGTEPYYWELFNKEWTLGFWVFLAVGSYLFIPIFEELFYRGYAQYRLEKEFSFLAVPLISLLFISVHLQYFVPDVLNIGLLIGFFILSLGKAFLRFRLVSIVGPIIIHSLMNVPLEFPYDAFILALMIVVVITMRKKILAIYEDFISELKTSNLKANSIYFLCIILFASGMFVLPEITLAVLVVLLIVSLVVQIVLKKKRSTKIDLKNTDLS